MFWAGVHRLCEMNYPPCLYSGSTPVTAVAYTSAFNRQTAVGNLSKSDFKNICDEN